MVVNKSKGLDQRQTMMVVSLTVVGVGLVVVVVDDDNGNCRSVEL